VTRSLAPHKTLFLTLWCTRYANLF